MCGIHLPQLCVRGRRFYSHTWKGFVSVQISFWVNDVYWGLLFVASFYQEIFLWVWDCVHQSHRSEPLLFALVQPCCWLKQKTSPDLDLTCVGLFEWLHKTSWKKIGIMMISVRMWVTENLAYCCFLGCTQMTDLHLCSVFLLLFCRS